MEAPLYNLKTKTAGTVVVPEKIFGVRWNPDLVHQVAHSLLANQRRGTADAKGRGEVRGGGKKPWRQKGTGRARHGSIRSPIWIGGGATHGPTAERRYHQKINKKMGLKALATVLSKKLVDGEVLFIEGLGLEKINTKNAKAQLEQLAGVPGFKEAAYQRGKRVLLALPEADAAMTKSFANLKTVAVAEIRNLNSLQLLNYRYVFLPAAEKSLAVLNQRLK